MKSAVGVILIVTCIFFGTSFVLAHGGATGVVKERMDLMETIGEATKTLAAMFKGERDYDAAAVRAAAVSIRDHAGTKMTNLFPKGSLDKPSEALPTVWEAWDEFRVLADKLAAYSDALARAAENPRGEDFGSGKMDQGRQVMAGGDLDAEALAAMPPDAAFKEIARTCRSCHGKFRAKKN